MLLALGDWTDKAGQSTAHKYTASKYTLSDRAKRAILSCEISPEVLQECADVAADGVAAELRLDCVRVWEGVTFRTFSACQL